MSTRHMGGFSVIMPETRDLIAQELAAEKGIVLIAEPDRFGLENKTIDIDLHLVGKPTLNGNMVIAKRGSEKIKGEWWQTNWQCDRLYRLHRKRPPTDDPAVNSAREFFERLSVGPYELTIGFEYSTSFRLWEDKSLALYIPRRANARPAFVHALTAMTNELNAELAKEKRTDFRFTPARIEKMADYATEDLKTGKIFKKNVQAGQDADALLGI